MPSCESTSLREAAQVAADYPPDIISSLSNNAPLTESEVKAVRSFRAAPAVALAKIREQIEGLERHARDLKEEAALHANKVKACDMILAPIRRVPLDVLREIIHHSMPKHPAPSRYHGPLPLGRVCSTWRAVVLSSPRLWTTLFLAIQSPTQLEQYIELVKEWFSRAKGLPLSFYFYFTRDLWNARYREYLAHNLKVFLMSITPAITHVRRLGIGCPRICNIRQCFMPVRWDLRELERLDFLSSRAYCSEYLANFDDDEIAAMGAVTLFDATPSLTTAVVDQVFVSASELPDVLPWSQLTHVVISKGIYVRHWILTMELCTQLRTGDFIIVASRHDLLNLSAASPRVHAHLENLVIKLERSYDPRAVFNNLLQLFHLPNLVTLALYFGIANDHVGALTNDHEGIQLLGSLHALSISGIDLPAAYIHRLLDETVNLRELSVPIFSNTPGDLLLEAMVYGNTRRSSDNNYSIGSNILPQLSVLTLVLLAMPNPEETATLGTMLLSRCNRVLPANCQPLTKVVLVLPARSGSLAHTLELDLEQCEAAGLQVDVQKLDDEEEFPRRRLAPFKGWNPYVYLTLPH
ncbi:hypothetical protein BDZ97DRAFT_1919652 [Flammula alnicola]|nr:hypothetical protein BDZ97DRAFT_1919652 [Flammula alnicola]